MSRREPLVPFHCFDSEKVLFDRQAIEAVNPHRHEMQLLDGILFESINDNSCVGFRRVRNNEFWARGHMPGNPLMPGVLICETAAQASSFFCLRHNLLETDDIGMGGADDVKIRAPVRPGQDLVVMARQLRWKPRLMIETAFQAWVGTRLVADGFIKGVAMRTETG